MRHPMILRLIAHIAVLFDAGSMHEPPLFESMKGHIYGNVPRGFKAFLP